MLMGRDNVDRLLDDDDDDDVDGLVDEDDDDDGTHCPTCFLAWAECECEDDYRDDDGSDDDEGDDDAA